MNYPTILMIRPFRFGFNPQTADNNEFQQSPDFSAGQKQSILDEIADKALQEFDFFVEKLREQDIDVWVLQDDDSPLTPDSIFPNNWFSSHEDGTLILYPMYAPNRREERKSHVIQNFHRQFEISKTIDFSHFENENKFLESTGSIILDRKNKVLFANVSERTDKEVLDKVSKELGYTSVVFHAFDRDNNPIYHTNVLMCMGDEFAVICLEAIPEKYREQVISALRALNKEIVDISMHQLENFCGNMLQVNNKQNKPFLVMSEAAFKSLDQSQIEIIEKYNTLLHAPLYTIEKYGGGSARCMMAEIYWKKK